MHIISFDASPTQASKLRNGHTVRIKRGSGFNVIVNPGNYNLVNKAFRKDKGINLKLSDDEIHFNKNLSPDQQKQLIDSSDDTLHSKASGGSIFKKINKALHSKTAKQIGRELKPLSRALKSTARQMAHEKVAEMHMQGADRYGDNEHARNLMNVGAMMAHEKIGSGLNTHNALKLASLANYNANSALAKMHNASVHGRLETPPIKSYYNSPLEPHSRGSGINMAGRGTTIHHNNVHQAMQSQPYSANFHMQFQLPPNYKKFNGGGLYA